MSLLCSCAVSIQQVKSQEGTIVYILSDGSIDSSGVAVPIQRDGDVYTFTDNMDYPLVVQCNNVTIDGADEIDNELNLIKGGGGCLLQEKIVASNSKMFLIIADWRKKSSKLGENWKTGIPVEIVPEAHKMLLRNLKSLGGKPNLRMAKSKMGPVVTDNGHFIIDVDFGCGLL